MTEWVLLVLFRFEFESFDFHSGLKEIHWRLHDSLDSNTEHGSGHVAVHRHTVGLWCWLIMQKKIIFSWVILATGIIVIISFTPL